MVLKITTKKEKKKKTETKKQKNRNKKAKKKSRKAEKQKSRKKRLVKSPMRTSVCSEEEDEEECSLERKTGLGRSTANTCLVPLTSGYKYVNNEPIIKYILQKK